MLYKDDWERTQQRFKEFWARENHDRPLISIEGVPRDGSRARSIRAPERLEDRWLDSEYIIRSSRERFSRTFFAGESYPIVWPNLGPDILGAMLGCPLHFAEDTTWVDHDLQSWDCWHGVDLSPGNRWRSRLRTMTEELVRDADGDYFVGITDLHPGGDALAALRGPENLCLDVLENAEAVCRANREIHELFKAVLNEQYDITRRNLPGSTNYAYLWHPGKWYAICNDFSCMISDAMFRDLFLDELVDEMRFLDSVIYHLDGPGALHHLDTLLALPEMGGIQWIPGAGHPSGAHWIPLLRKIQKAGKVAQHYLSAMEIDLHLESLEPEGMAYYITDCRSEQDARDIMERAARSYRRKSF